MMNVEKKRSGKFYGYKVVLDNRLQVNVVHPKFLTNIKSGSGSFKGIDRMAKSLKTLPFY